MRGAIRGMCVFTFHCVRFVLESHSTVLFFVLFVPRKVGGGGVRGDRDELALDRCPFGKEREPTYEVDVGVDFCQNMPFSRDTRCR